MDVNPAAAPDCTQDSGIDIPALRPGGLAARLAALAVLDSVLSRKNTLDQSLEDEASLKALETRDRAFARMLAATVLRRLGQIDDCLLRAQERPGAPLPDLARTILRMGVAQILFMEVPDHAAVDTSVRLAESARLDGLKGFVNAVLRKVAAHGAEWFGHQDEARLSVPAWILDPWVADYGPEIAARIAGASRGEAPLDISVKNPAMTEYWAEALEADILPTGTLRKAPGGTVVDLPGFEDGMWWVQDVSSALPVRLFGDIAGRSVVDLCAAPGGKTAQLAARGAHVIAIDRSARRLARLESNLARLRLQKQVRIVSADAAMWQPARGEPVDAILLDAPCTATGTLRRHPDIPHIKTPTDLQRLLAVQERLLVNAVERLAPGGTLVYCTCSLQKDEGERHIERLLLSGAPVQRRPVSADEIGGLSALVTEAGDVRIFPFHMEERGGMDGFYMARLQKL